MSEKDTTRVEAFSDGVFAIAITLLILEIRVPKLDPGAGDRALLAALGALWPSFIAFVLSFAVILVMWINHHELMRLIQRVDYPFLLANGLLLLMVTFVPFPTAVLAQHLGGAAQNSAAAFYCGTFFLIGAAFNGVLASAAHKRRLVQHHVPDQVVERIRRAYRLGLVVYGASAALSLWNASAGLILCASLWVLWIRLAYRD